MIRFAIRWTFRSVLAFVALIALWIGLSVAGALSTDTYYHGDNYDPVFEQDFSQPSGCVC
jgi:hypothetical protein